MENVMTTKNSRLTYTAADIEIALARKHKDDYFLTEVKSGSSTMGTGNRILDAVALRRSYVNPYITGYEVKVTRSDYQRDNKFYTYLPLVHALYIVTPTGLIQREEAPTDIGLIWYDQLTKHLTTKKRPPPRNIEISRDMLLYIIYSRLDPDHIPFYSDVAEYWRAWVEGKKSNDILGQQVRGKITDEINRLESELRREKRRKNDDRSDEYNRMIACLRNHGVPPYISTDPVTWLNDMLSCGYPPILDAVQQTLESAINSIKNAKATKEYGRERQSFGSE
jgi:hypothetical protein